MGQLLFWMSNPPDATILGPQWLSFRETMAAWVVVSTLSTILVMVTFYAIHARRKKIRTPGDLFAAYTPMWWLALSLIPGVVVFVRYLISYKATFPPAVEVFAMAGATQIGLWAILLAIVITYLLILIPGFTPSKFRYRPLPAFLLRWRMKS